MPNVPEVSPHDVELEKTAIEALAKSVAEATPTTRAKVEEVLTETPAESTIQNAFLGKEASVTLKAKGEGNTAMGAEALKAATTGTLNTGVGSLALKALTTGGSNVGVGWNTLPLVVSGTTNVGVGTSVLAKNTGSGNIGVGTNTLNANTSGAGNLGIGNEALLEVKTGDKNVAVGNNSGQEALGSGNVFIGNEAGEAETGSNTLYIANNATTPLIAGTLSGTQKLGFYGVTPVNKAAEIKVPGAYKLGVAAFESEAEAKAIRDKLTAVIEALKGIGICV